MQDLIWKYHVSPSPEQEAGMASAGGWGSGTVNWFGAGRAAMTYGGRYWLVPLRSRKDFPDLRLGVAEFQCGPQRVYRGYAGSVMINKFSRHRADALKYLVYMAGPDFNRLVNNQADGLAPVKIYSQTKEFLLNPDFPEETQNHVWREVMEHAIADEMSPFVNGYLARRIMDVQLDLVKRNDKPVAEALRAAAQEINAEIVKTAARDPELHRRYEQSLIAQRAEGAGK
jgi:ABC-type glycerol-3-phosphate transport system substrate-binding protein